VLVPMLPVDPSTATPRTAGGDRRISPIGEARGPCSDEGPGPGAGDAVASVAGMGVGAMRGTSGESPGKRIGES
jgi:hypothetical protein